MQFSSSFFVCLMTAYAAVAAPTELEARQIGDLQCNIARLGVVASLKQASTSTAALATVATGTDAQAVTDAATAIKGAQAAVNGIAQALVSGTAAPPELRTFTGGNITAAGTALASITDLAGNADLTSAIKAVQSAGSNGEKVVSECK